MKIFLALFFSLSLLLALKAYSLEKGKWSFVKTDEYCYIGSLPIETDLAPEKNRGDHYILVYKNIGNTETKICVVNSKKKIIKKIDLQTKKISRGYFLKKNSLFKKE